MSCNVVECNSMSWNAMEWYGCIHACMHTCTLFWFAIAMYENIMKLSNTLIYVGGRLVDTVLPFTMPRHSSACTVGSPTVFLALDVELLSNSDPSWHVTILRWRWRLLLCEPWNFGQMKKDLSERRDFGYKMMIYCGLYFVIIDSELNSTTFKVLAVVRGWHIAL